MFLSTARLGTDVLLSLRSLFILDAVFNVLPVYSYSLQPQNAQVFVNAYGDSKHPPPLLAS